MNKEQFQGMWNEIKGKVKQNWGKLTDDDIARINGKREELLGKLQARYGYAKEKAEEEMTKFEKMHSNLESTKSHSHKHH